MFLEISDYIRLNIQNIDAHTNYQVDHFSMTSII